MRSPTRRSATRHMNNTPRRSGVAVAALLLSACGTQIGPLTLPGSSSSSPPAAAVAADATPAVPTAVQVVALTSDGIAGFFPFEGTSSSYTRADMKRDENALKGTGAVSRFFMPNSATATITRLDRKLVYALDIPRSEYTECPLSGCVSPTPPPQQQPREQRPPESSREPGCTMKVASNTFNVKPTSQRKPINGFDTEQYAVDWSVTLEDPSKRRSTLQLTIDFWTTAITPSLRDAMAMESSYARARTAAADRSASAAAAAAALPPQFMDMLNRYFGQSMTAADRAALFNIGRQMERIKGQPIVTTLRLFYSGNACGGAEQGAGGTGAGTGSGGIAGALSGLFGGGSSSPASGGSGAGSGIGERPLLSFTQEVKTWKIEPVRDSQFAPPPQFKRKNPG